MRLLFTLIYSKIIAINDSNISVPRNVLDSRNIIHLAFFRYVRLIRNGFSFTFFLFMFSRVMLAADFLIKKIKFSTGQQRRIIFLSLRYHRTRCPRPTST